MREGGMSEVTFGQGSSWISENLKILCIFIIKITLHGDKQILKNVDIK
jgi:hypothetical protein